MEALCSAGSAIDGDSRASHRKKKRLQQKNNNQQRERGQGTWSGI
jgi:hypothetical protein